MNKNNYLKFLCTLSLLSTFTGCGSSSEFSDDGSKTDNAIEKIANYADSNVNPIPTLQDYENAGVTGVTAYNLDVVNTNIDAATEEQADTVAEIQDFATSGVIIQGALDKIQAYAEDTNNPIPSVEDYANAGVTGVTAANVDEVNANIDAATEEQADTVAEIQDLATSGATTQVALDKIKAYAKNSNNLIPSVEDYANAGVTGVTAANVDEVNANIDAATEEQADIISEIQDLATLGATRRVALDKIQAYAKDSNNSIPSVEDYVNAGVTGVTAANLDEVNVNIDAATEEQADTVAEIQDLATSGSTAQVALNKIQAYADDNSNPAPTLADYTNAGVTGVDADNLDDVNEKVDAAVKADADSVSEIQTLADAVVAEDASNTVLAEIGADDDANSSDVTIAELNKILPALTDVTVANEAAYQAYIADSANAFDAPATPAQVQAMVTAVNAAVATLVITSLTPTDGSTISTSAVASGNLTVTFDKDVSKVTGKNVHIKRVSDDGIHSTMTTGDIDDISVSGATATLDPNESHLAYGKSYYVEIDTGTFKDGANVDHNGISDKTTWNFDVTSGSGPCGCDDFDNADLSDDNQ